MTQATLDRLVVRERALVDALDAGFAPGAADAVAAAAADLAGAVAEVAAAGAWRERADLKDQLTHALRLAEAATRRVNYHVDRNRRRLDRLAALSGGPLAQRYGRTGRLG